MFGIFCSNHIISFFKKISTALSCFLFTPEVPFNTVKKTRRTWVSQAGQMEPSFGCLEMGQSVAHKLHPWGVTFIELLTDQRIDRRSAQRFHKERV